MTIVIPSGECGNSPKNLLLENISIAFATGDAQLILDSATTDACWYVVGQQRVEGKTALAEALERLKDEPAAEIIIQHVSSHGRAGAVNGLTRLDDGRRLAFCHVFEFGNTKGTQVREITSYVIELAQ